MTTAPDRRAHPAWWVRASELYGAGLSCTRIGLALGYNQATVYRALRVLGVPLRGELRVAIPHKETGPVEPTSNGSAHSRVKRLWGRAANYDCVACGKPAREWAYDGTDPTYLLGPERPGGGLVRFSRFPEFYMPMCIVCHKRRDKADAARELGEYRQWKFAEGVSSIQEYMERSRNAAT